MISVTADSDVIADLDGHRGNLAPGPMPVVAARDTYRN